MIRRIAFLRAINVGGHTVKMDRLRALFEEMGLANVETFIASGNVIFDSPVESDQDLRQLIEVHLHQSLGYEVATFLRTLPEVAAAAECQPFGSQAESGSEKTRLYVAFLYEAPGEAACQKVMALQTPVDDFHFVGRELYWLCRVSSMESEFSGAVLERTLGMPATMRNITTVRRLAAKYAGK